MYQKIYVINLVGLIGLLVITNVVNAQEKITGPWLWMIAPTAPGQGGAASIDIDSLAVASQGAVTEADIASNGANENDWVGGYRWTLGEISPTGPNNINECINRIGLSSHTDINDHTSYALITLESATVQPGMAMQVGSDDAIKVWLNGEVVHTNPINRGALGYQEEFPVDLQAGKNLLMVKVSELGTDWGMFIGINADVTTSGKRIRRQSREIVQLIYFLPRDRQPQPGIDPQLDILIKDAQQFYAEQMESHGFGRKTFRTETDRSGNAVVHHIEGKFNEVYYQQESWNRVWTEIEEQFHSANIYVAVMDIDVGVDIFCGAGVSLGFNGGRVLLPATNPCFNLRTLTHELGHSFDLYHDFRDDAYRMSYGEKSDQLSRCAAEWLNAHRYFNNSPIAADTPTMIEMLPSLSQSADVLQLRFKLTDPDGLHQAQLHTPETLLACKGLNSESSTIEFNATELMKKSDIEVWLRVIDVQGNITHRSFPDYINIANPIEKITGPWLWMIAPTAPGQGGATSIDIDSLAVASQRTVTEADVAINGANEGDKVGDYTWTLGEISPTGPNNINECINRIGLSRHTHIDHHSSYALITLESATTQPGVAMRVGSDDAIKVWLNGEVVHTNPINRGASDFQDTFNVNLKEGDNLLLVKVSDWIVDWSMFVGIDADVRAVYKRPRRGLERVDINGDGIVNIRDLVLVVASFGSTEESPADVDGDGVVNIKDMVLVANAFHADTAAAPGLHSRDFLEGLTGADARSMLTQAQQMALADPVYGRAASVLPQLLSHLMPKRTALLPNYPNPFNPETWIPYQLAEPADVTISIYTTDGKLVRTLALGYQPIGVYESRSRAAYWDGRNDAGESVASGLYFFQMETDNVSLMRKMVILK